MIFKNKSAVLKTVLIMLILISGVVFFAVRYIETTVMPRGAEVLHSYAETNMFDILNSTVNEVIEKYGLQYSNLAKIQYAENGSISSIEIDYVLVNRIKSEISLIISEKISEQDEIPVYVPLGTFSKNMYFIGKGPHIKFTLMQRGCIQTDFEHSFESAGVNQTMHTLKIVIDADIALMIPFYNTHTNMKTSAILAQTVINGECPSRYLNINEGEI